jgi:hypothetical protein
MKRTFYAVLGMVAWRVGKRYMRRRVSGLRPTLTR